MSDEKRDLFEYRSKNEINGLATLAGKYLPVFLPHIIFLKMVVELSTWRMTRTVIAMQSAAVMVLVFRLTGLLMLSLKLHARPRPGKVHTTDVYYKLPVYYSIHHSMMAEMETGGCDQFVNICYNPESTTFISGKKCDHWNSIINLTKKVLVESTAKPTRIDPEANKLVSTSGIC